MITKDFKCSTSTILKVVYYHGLRTFHLTLIAAMLYSFAFSSQYYYFLTPLFCMSRTFLYGACTMRRVGARPAGQSR